MRTKKAPTGMEILRKKLFEEIIKKELKYCNLVWYCRSFGWNDLSEDQLDAVIKNRSELELLYPQEVSDLLNDESNWNHGFNSGMLAAIRWVLTLDEYGLEEAEYEFPFLDT